MGRRSGTGRFGWNQPKLNVCWPRAWTGRLKQMAESCSAKITSQQQATSSARWTHLLTTNKLTRFYSGREIKFCN